MILLSGFAADHTFWAGLLPSLVARYRVLTMDSHGAGRSSAPDELYDVQRLRSDLGDWLYLATVIDCRTKAVVSFVGRPYESRARGRRDHDGRTNIDIAHGAVFHPDQAPEISPAGLAIRDRGEGSLPSPWPGLLRRRYW